MKLPLDEDNRRKLLWVFSLTLCLGVFFLGIFLLNRPALRNLISPVPSQAQSNYEVFGFAPYWTLSKINNIDWDTLSTFAYFSLPVNYDGSIEMGSYEWQVFEGERLHDLFEKAKSEKVKRVVTLTQMEASTIEAFLSDQAAWKRLAWESVDIINGRGLDGVNVDFEYVRTNEELKNKFSDFIETYSRILRENTKNPYITVSVLASSARFDKIYDIARLGKHADAIFMMAYDFYYPGSEKVGPSAPLYGYNNGKGPFWYDVSTAVDDFLKLTDPSKIIMGVPYYGWNYPAYSPGPNNERVSGLRAFATTNEKVDNNKLLTITPVGGWDSQAQVAWRGYWDENGWHVVYVEDEKSLSLKYDFARNKGLKGVGIWALGFDADNDKLWSVLASKFKDQYLSLQPAKTWLF